MRWCSPRALQRGQPNLAVGAFGLHERAGADRLCIVKKYWQKYRSLDLKGNIVAKVTNGKMFVLRKVGG